MAEEAEPRELPRGKLLPLNSKRLTAAHLRQIAEALGLPTTGSADELRSMVEGKLGTDCGREVRNVQAIVQDTPRIDTKVLLMDEEGVFLETTPFQRAGKDVGTEIESIEQALAEATQQNTELSAELEKEKERTVKLTEELEKRTAEATDAGDVPALTAEVTKLRAEKERAAQIWKLNCEQAAEQETLLAARDEEIESLKKQIMELNTRLKLPAGGMDEGSGVADTSTRKCELSRPRRGRAPPIDQFTGEDPEVSLDDWLPALSRASCWNGWSEEELIQLAGHLKGRALQEWNLLEEDQKQNPSIAVQALRDRLSPGSKILAAQDFRHMTQGETEPVADFIHRLERVFRVAYGRDKLSQET